MEWIPAKVGCYWTSGEFFIATTTDSRGSYCLTRNREEVGHYKTLRAAQRAAAFEAKKTKFLVLSYNTDEQQGHYDHVMAVSPEAALEFIASARPDCIPIECFESNDLRNFGNDLDKRPNAEILSGMAALQMEAQS